MKGARKLKRALHVKSDLRERLKVRARTGFWNLQGRFFNSGFSLMVGTVPQAIVPPLASVKRGHLFNKGPTIFAVAVLPT